MIAAKTAALFGAASELGALCAPCDAQAVRTLPRARVARTGWRFRFATMCHGIWATADATGKVDRATTSRGANGRFRSCGRWRSRPRPRESGSRPPTRRGRRSTRAAVTAVIEALEEFGAREAARAAIAEHLSVVERHPVASRSRLFAEYARDGEAAVSTVKTDLRGLSTAHSDVVRSGLAVVGCWPRA